MSAATATINPSSAVFRVPVFGQLFRDAVFGKNDAKYYFAFNLALLLGWTFFVFGYAAVIIYALAGTFSAMVFLVVLTSADLFEQAARKKAQDSGAKRA